MELEKITYMINLDSLIAGEIAYVYGDAGFNGNLRDMVLNESRRLGYDLEGKTAEELDPPDEPCECSDYFPFRQAGIPYIYFESTNWNLGDQDGWTQVDEDLGDNGMIWHTPYDTIAYIDRIAPDRIDERLEMFVNLLVEALTKFKLS
jgi:Zn-dependent M28 family amino/carboxypeptidase